MFPRSFIESAKRVVARTYVPQEFFQLVRFECYLLLIRWNNRLNPFQIAKRRRLMKLRDVNLHWGCGEKPLDGWVNVDGWKAPGVDYVMDLRCPLPLADGSVRYVFTEHVLEHVTFEQGQAILQDFHRIMQPGGVVRIIMPDLQRYCAAYVNDDAEWFERAGSDFPSTAQSVNFIFYGHFHRFIHDFHSIETSLREAGFRIVERSHHLGSEHEALQLDTDIAERALPSLYVEAEK